jgi:hypothetical protein
MRQARVVDHWKIKIADPEFRGARIHPAVSRLGRLDFQTEKPLFRLRLEMYELFRKTGGCLILCLHLQIACTNAKREESNTREFLLHDESSHG